MKLEDLGEFGLIDRIKPLFIPLTDDIIGIGDDCAVIRRKEGPAWLVTADLLVERVHFIRKYISPFDLGRKSTAVNLSDIAAMGGKPVYAVLSIAIAPGIDLPFMDQFYEGVRTICREFEVSLIGGDTTSSKNDLAINITVIGEVEYENILFRSGAEPGDRIYVTGVLGDSAAGLHLLGAGYTRESKKLDYFDKLEQAHNNPRPHCREGYLLAKSGLAHSMIDISDGTAGDMMHICERSGVGARLYADRMPLSDECKKAAELLNQDPTEWALRGGEDYCLIFTADPDNENTIRNILKKRSKTSHAVFAIGEVTEDKRCLIIRSNGDEQEIKKGGWIHFQSH